MRKYIQGYAVHAIVWAGLVLTGLPGVVFGQEKIDGKHALTDVFEYVEKTYDIKLSFDASFIGPLYTDQDYFENDLPALFEQLSQNAPFVITEVSDGFFVVKAQEKGYLITVEEADTGTPISAAQINLFINNDPVKIKAGAEANSINFQAKLHPRDTIQLYTYGYHTLAIPAAQLLNGSSITAMMNANPILLSEVVVSNYLAPGINANTLAHSLDIDMKNLALLPGETDGDILESIKILPGVSSPDSRAGNVYIRGSSTDQSLILYDDIPIYHRGHYFGTISPYNPKVVGGISVYRNGFHPRLGGRVGGAVDIRSASDINDKPRYGVFVNSINAMAYLATPLKDNKVGVLVSGRKSFPASWNTPKLAAISDMVYQSSKVEQALNVNRISNFQINYSDATAKVLFNVNDKNKITVSTLYILNIMSYVADQANLRFTEENRLENLGLNVKWDAQLTSKIRSSLSLTQSDYSYSFSSLGRDIRSNALNTDQQTVNDLQDMSANFQVMSTIGSTDLLNVGFETRRQKTSFDYRNLTANMQRPDDNVVLEDEIAALSYSPYINYEFNRFKNLYVQAGLRTTYYSELSDLAFAPRLFVNYNLTPNWQLKGSYGLYNQYLSQIRNLEFANSGFDNQLWLLSRSGQVDIIRGQQKMIGTIFHQKGWVLDIEAYEKNTDNVSYLTTRFLANRSEYVSADIKTSGIDIFIKKRINQTLSTWMSYSISKSVLAFDTLRNRYYRTEYDQPHIFKLGGIYARGNWKVSLGWRLMSGLYAQFPVANDNRPDNGDVIEGSGQQGMPPGGPMRPNPPLLENQHLTPYAETRFPTMHQLDASISWTLPRTPTRKWQGTIGLSLVNLYNNQNLIDQVDRRQQNGDPLFEDRFGIGFAPNIMLSIEW